MGIAYPIASKLAGQDAAALGDATDRFGGLGRNGAQRTPKLPSASIFNSVRLRVFNGGHLTLPSSNQQMVLRPHQKNAVRQIVQSDNILLAHAVGAGKTYTMVAAGIEAKLLGLATKPIPNHMLAQFSSAIPNGEHSCGRQRRLRGVAARAYV